MILSELVLVLASSVISLAGIWSNYRVVKCIFSTRHSSKIQSSLSKILAQKHYTLMGIHCGFNVAVFVVQIMSLLNECHESPVGFFCSAAHGLVAFQYFKVTKFFNI